MSQRLQSLEINELFDGPFPDSWMSIYSPNSPRLIENLSMQLYQKITSNNLVDSFLKYIDSRHHVWELIVN